MTTSDRAVSSGHLDDAGSLGSAESMPVPEGHPPAPPASGPDPRTHLAWHESGHACAQVILFGPDALRVASIRPGASHAGITILEPSGPVDRRERELAILVTLAGPEAEALVWSMP
jgi:ATP-dependent Zn protease